MARKKATKRRAPKGPKRDHYQEITDRIIASMEQGVAPWQRPWALSPFGSTPHNAVSGKSYRGINIWLTLMTQWERAYSTPIWVSFKQANEIAAKAMRKAGRKVEKNKRGVYVFADGEDKGKSVGGVRKGQNKANGCGGTEVVYWEPKTRMEQNEDGEEERRSWLLVRVYTVFNIDQCDQHVRDYVCPPQAPAPEFKPLEACERICEEWAEVPVGHGGDRAYYSPREDRIQLPERPQFKSPEEYYTTRFHEMAHATGHPSRLDRFKVGEYRERHEYAAEELVAEFTACFLAGEAGIVRTVEKNSAAYLKVWASRLKEDPRIVVHAAQRAQKAADLILGRQPARTEEAPEESSEAA